MKVFALFALVAFVAVARSQVENPTLQCYSCAGDECDDLTSDMLITCYQDDDTPAVTTPSPTDTTQPEGSVPTTEAPVSTTEGSVPTTEAPVSTTEGSVTTTEAPVSTTEAPVSTTVPTTETPVPTTETPVPTTETPVPTTETPVPTTETPVPTTEAPVATTETPVPTTEAPVATTETPVPTTEAPVATTETPVPTTEAPVATTETPVPTTETPVPTTETPGPSAQNAIVSSGALRQVIVRQSSPAAQLIRNYRSISRTGRALSMYFCYTINVKDGDSTKEQRGCSLVPSGEAACPIIEAGLSSPSDCKVCQTDGCNSGAMAFQLSVAALLAAIIVKFLM